MKFDKRYVVTFEERIRDGCDLVWYEGSRIFDDLETVRDFLEFMYSTGEENFRQARVWCGVEVIHTTEVKVVFDEDAEE